MKLANFTKNLLQSATVLSIAASTLAMLPAQAAPLASGTWQSFSFGGVGSSSDPETFDFTAGPDGDILKITDAFLKGDRFEVFDFGTLLGSTSIVPTSTDDTTSNPDLAFADLTYSKGTFFLAPGLRSISIRVLDSPFGSGGAFIRRDSAPPSTAVPTPALLPGLIGLGLGVARKRKLAKQAAEV
jgi:hypothetical protein